MKIIIIKEIFVYTYHFEESWSRVARATPEILSKHWNSAKYGPFFQTIFPFLITIIRNNFITGYADCPDLQDYIKNNFVIDYADYTDLQVSLKIILSLTAMTALICKTRLKMISLFIMATLIFSSNSHHWLRWLLSSTYNN